MERYNYEDVFAELVYNFCRSDYLWDKLSVKIAHYIDRGYGGSKFDPENFGKEFAFYLRKELFGGITGLPLTPGMYYDLLACAIENTEFDLVLKLLAEDVLEIGVDRIFRESRWEAHEAHNEGEIFYIELRDKNADANITADSKLENDDVNNTADSKQENNDLYDDPTDENGNVVFDKVLAQIEKRKLERRKIF